MAKIVAGAAQIAGGIAPPWIRRQFRRRTSALIVIAVLIAVTLALIDLVEKSRWGRCAEKSRSLIAT